LFIAKPLQISLNTRVENPFFIRMPCDEILNSIYGAHKYNFYKVSWNIKGPFISPWKERTSHRLNYVTAERFQRTEGISTAYSRGRYKFIWMTKWGPISRSLTRDLTKSRRESFHLHVYGGSVFYCPTKVCDHPGKRDGGAEGRTGRYREAFIIVWHETNE